MLAGPPSRPKFIMIGRGVAAPHMGEVVDMRSFFGNISGQRQADPNARVPHIIYQSTRFRPRMCLWESHRYISSHRGLSPQTLILGTSMGISSLNVYGHISAQDKRITTLHSSKCASRKDTQCAVVKTMGWGHCRAQTYISLFQRQIYS
jgi:hypothetical protein